MAVIQAAEDLLGMDRARGELGLELGEFEVALQVAEVRTAQSGVGRRRIPLGEVERLRAEDGFPSALRRRLAVVGSIEAAELIGINRDRFTRLARGGLISPVRWYANRYRAVVWLYLADDVRGLARDRPELLTGRLPAALRQALGEGEDHRARGWRARRAAGFVRDAVDAWGEAAVWAELLGPEAAARIVPDVAERTYLRRLRPGMPPGGTGAHAVRAVVEAVVVAGHPDEVADARDRLAEALTRARAERPAPCPGRSAPAHPQAPAGAERRRRGWRALFTRPAGPPGGRCAGGCDAARV